MLIVLCLIVSWAQIAVAAELPIEFELDSGYRTDNLRWNIAGDLSGENPNILSELTWPDITILQINGLSTMPLGKSLFMQGSLSFGVIISGKNQDSDYWGDNRTEEFSRSNNRNHGDNVFDLSISLGHDLTGTENKFRLAPMAGFAFNQQNLRITDGYQSINTGPDNEIPGYTGPFSGLNSTYRASWTGPWLGAALSGDLNPKWTMFGDFEYHWAVYDGEGDWNLRGDLAHPVSFTHHAAGIGYRWSAGINFSSSPQLHLTLKFISNSWSTNAGIARVFGAEGSIVSTCLNEVSLASQAVMFTLSWKPEPGR